MSGDANYTLIKSGLKIKIWKSMAFKGMRLDEIPYGERGKMEKSRGSRTEP